MAFAEVGVEVGDAPGIVHLAVCELVGHRAAVLGHDDRGVVVALVDPVKEPAEAPRHHGPVGSRTLPGGVGRERGAGVGGDAGVGVGRQVEVCARLRLGGEERGVVVEPEVVARPAHERGVGVAEDGQALAQPRAHRGRVVAVVERIGEPAEEELHGALGRRAVLGAVRGRLAPVAVVRQPDDAALARLVAPAVEVGRLRVRAQQVVAYLVGLHVRDAPRREDPVPVPLDRHHPRLVERDPVLHPVAEVLEADLGVVAEEVRHLGPEPAVVLELERRRVVPVIERRPGRDAAVEQRVDQVRVEGDAFAVRFAVAGREDAGPRDREAVRLQPHRRHEPHVFAEAVVVVAGDVARVAVPRLAGGVGEDVPDRRPLAAFLPSAFDLVARRSRAPDEALGKQLHVRSPSEKRMPGGSPGRAGMPRRDVVPEYRKHAMPRQHARETSPLRCTHRLCTNAPDRAPEARSIHLGFRKCSSTPAGRLSVRRNATRCAEDVLRRAFKRICYFGSQSLHSPLPFS